MITVMKVGIEALKEMIEVDDIWSTKRRGKRRWLSLDSWHVHWNYNVQLRHSSVHNTVYLANVFFVRNSEISI